MSSVDLKARSYVKAIERRPDLCFPVGFRIRNEDAEQIYLHLLTLRLHFGLRLGPFLRAASALDSALGDDYHAEFLLRAHAEMSPPVRAVDRILDKITVLPPGLVRSRGVTLLNQDPAYPYSVPTELLRENGLLGHLDQIRQEVDAMHLKDLRLSSTFQLDLQVEAPKAPKTPEAPEAPEAPEVPEAPADTEREEWWTAYEPEAPEAPADTGVELFVTLVAPEALCCFWYCCC
ncbi:hypothetical protein BSKO_02059 [Bryopsis sp. KO-2023]|nr:hypothetical protein BSKO_02059 [Bryopsis sp. KO-2023]